MVNILQDDQSYLHYLEGIDLRDLYGIERMLDKEKYPERCILVQREIAFRESELEEERRNNPSWLDRLLDKWFPQ